jgi:hypothetical protein
MSKAYPFAVADSRGLDLATIQHHVPSIFASEKHDSRSQRYTYIPTSIILEQLSKEGFVVTAAMQSRSRIEGKTEYTKHLVRLCHRNELAKQNRIEAVLINSHDGTSAYKLLQGMFRMVCSNGQISGDYQTPISIHHKGDIASNVVEGTLRIIEESGELANSIEEMSHISLSRPEQALLSELSMRARYGQVEEVDPDTGIVVVGNAPVAFRPEQFLRARRREDSTDSNMNRSLWVTENVIQENMMRGGIATRDERGKKHSTRAVNSVDTNVKLNQLLWGLAEGMKKIKQGADIESLLSTM